MNFARTKIQPPRMRPQLVERRALTQRLSAGLAEARMALVVAPAGYGKTVALTELLAARPDGEALAWVALDEDDDLGRVAACLVAALEPCDLPWRSSPEALILAAEDGSRAARLALVAALINALDASEAPAGLLVFDDAHRVTDPAVFELLDALVERLPERWHLLLASRGDPPMALARLRARGDLFELRREDLDFSADEVRTLARRRRPDCSEAEIAALHERTQGWPAGLGLALSEGAAPGSGSSGSLRERTVFDYLASEVLDRMPAALRAFLLRCSVLPELTAERCAAVSGDAHAVQWLDDIEQRGLFVSALDGETRTLKLHDLFRDCLDDRLRRELPAELPMLLKRAAATEPDATRRLGYLLRAGDWPEAEALLGRVAPRLLTLGATHSVLRMVGQFPPDFAQASGPVQLVLTVAHWSQWNWLAMRQAGQRAADRFAQRGDEPNRRRALSYLAVACSNGDDDGLAQRTIDALLFEPLDHDTLCRALLASSTLALSEDQPAQVASLWSQIVAALEHTDSLEAWCECAPAPSSIGAPGMREPLQRYVLGARSRLPEQPIPLSGMLHVMQGWLRLWAGDRAGAARAQRLADDDSRWLGRPTGLQLQSLMLQTMLQALAGDGAGTRHAGQAAIDLVETMPDPTQRTSYRARMAYWVGRNAAIAGDTALLQEMNALLDRHDGDPEWRLPRPLRLALQGHAALADGDTERAIAAWTEATQVEGHHDVFGRNSELRLRLADLLASSGRLGEAAELLAPVFERIAAGGETGPALTAGPQVLERLGHQAWGRRLDAARAAALRDWAAAARALRKTEPAVPAAVAKTTATTAPAAADALSAREHEVLERIAAGDSNKLIARALDLSPHTVKRHVANILDKLALASRGQAAAWYRGSR